VGMADAASQATRGYVHVEERVELKATAIAVASISWDSSPFLCSIIGSCSR
jgi:hypothetical protein